MIIHYCTAIITNDSFLVSSHHQFCCSHGLGRNSSNAIITIDRHRSWSGVGQNLDSRCILPGRFVEFSAWILLNKDGALVTDIDPDTRWYYRKSPQLSAHSRHHRDMSTKDYIYRSEANDLARLARPYKSDGWNLIHGIFRLPSTFNLLVEIDSAPEGIDFYLDDVSMQPFYCDRANVVRNGDLEELGVTKFWHSWGEPKIDLTTGYGGIGNAIRATKRPHYSHGPGQVINLDCGAKGKLISPRSG